MTRPHGHDALNAGFTLLEMLVVLTILALVSALAVPALMPSSERFRLQATAGELLGALRRARSVAIARNRETLVVIDVDAHVAVSTTGQRLRIGSDIDLQLKIAEPERTAPFRGGFRFFGDGSSTGGNVILELQGKTAHVCVDWLSGRARQAEQC